MMQMMVDEVKNTDTQTAQKEWLRKAAMETFTADEFQQMLSEKRKSQKKPKRSKAKYGIQCGLPEGYGNEYLS